MHMLPSLLHHSPPRILYAGAYTARTNHPLHSHETWEIIYQRSGHIDTRQGADVIAMHPGMVLVHPPRVEHADFASTEYSIFYIWIDAPVSPPWPRMHHDNAQMAVGRVCEAIWREWVGQGSDRQLMLEVLAMEIDIMLRRTGELQQRGEADNLVANVKRILDERFRDPPPIRALAGEVGTSRTRLYEQFVGQAGLTPAAYLAEVRLRNALSLIHGSTLTLEAVAERCGYHSASHLTRHVKAATGKSPGRLRREYDVTQSGARKVSSYSQPCVLTNPAQ